MSLRKEDKEGCFVLGLSFEVWHEEWMLCSQLGPRVRGRSSWFLVSGGAFAVIRLGTWSSKRRVWEPADAGSSAPPKKATPEP
ncbi:MAG: hypothetical protein NTV80_13920 [Verrucomicrobia bacterium]|nr:hypothetical protein [Verrucomicrobiota bacterium]